MPSIDPEATLYISTAQVSRILVPKYDFKAWLTKKYTAIGIFDELIKAIPRVPVTPPNAEVIKKNTVRLAKLFADDCLKGHYSALMTWFNSYLDTAATFPTSLHTPATGALSGTAVLKKGLCITTVSTWVTNNAQKALWDQQLATDRAGMTVATPGSTASSTFTAQSRGGVSCEVYLKSGTTWSKVGDTYQAVLRSSYDKHAEMKWKAAHAPAFSTALAGATDAEFHITKVPCGENCAAAMIGWWESLTKPEGFDKAHIFTHIDDDGKKRCYRLTDTAIHDLGVWT